MSGGGLGNAVAIPGLLNAGSATNVGGSSGSSSSSSSSSSSGSQTETQVLQSGSNPFGFNDLPPVVSSDSAQPPVASANNAPPVASADNAPPPASSDSAPPPASTSARKKRESPKSADNTWLSFITKLLGQ